MFLKIFFEIYIKKLIYVKLPQWAFQKYKIGKTHQTSGYLISNCDLLNFDNNFCYSIKFNSRIWIFILQCMNPMHMKFWDISLLMLKKLKMHWMNGIWVICIVNYELFKFLETIINSKDPFKHKQWLFSWTVFSNIFKYLITSQLEIGSGIFLSITFKYSYFNTIYIPNYMKYGLSKWTFHCYKWDTLTCFHMLAI